jgi:hypothetical protein
MKARTARWDTAIVTSHQIAVRADVLLSRSIVKSGLAVVSGKVTLDRTAAQYARCDVTFAEPLILPTAGGLLTPYGCELALQRGITYPDGTVEMMPLGVFPIQTATPEAVTLTTQIAAVDRSQLVADARLEDDYTIASGTNYASAILALISDGVPGLVYSFASTTYTTPSLTFPVQADRWAAAQGMATSIGCELFFDGFGQCVLRSEPAFSNVPVWTVADGSGGLMVRAAMLLDRRPAYNRVIATGQNSASAAVYRGVWSDTNTASPTFYDGPFGHKPRFYSSPFIASTAQATAAANAIGAAQQGVAKSLDFSFVPNPALEPSDAIRVKRTALGLDEIHLIDSLTIDLSAAGAMSGQSRAGS